MRTPCPTAWATLPLRKLATSAFDSTKARFRLFSIFNKADPFVAGKRSDVFPCRKGLWRRYKDLLQISWDFVDRAGGDFLTHRLPNRILPLNDTDKKNDDSDNKEDMNEASERVACNESEQPERKKNYGDSHHIV